MKNNKAELILEIPAKLTLSILGPAGGIDFVDPSPCHGPMIKNKKKGDSKASFLSPFLSSCDSGGIQTHNLLIRSQMLYSVELRNHRSLFAGAKVRTFFESTKLFGKFFKKKCVFTLILLFFELFTCLFDEFASEFLRIARTLDGGSQSVF